MRDTFMQFLNKKKECVDAYDDAVETNLPDTRVGQVIAQEIKEDNTVSAYTQTDIEKFLHWLGNTIRIDDLEYSFAPFIHKRWWKIDTSEHDYLSRVTRARSILGQFKNFLACTTNEERETLRITVQWN